MPPFFQKGHIRVDGIEVHDRATDLNHLRQKIGIVFQQWNAFPHLTVLENVMLAPRKVLGKSKAEAEALAVQQLTHVGLGDKLKTFPGKLSGGQQQRMAIARALAMSPDYIMADKTVLVVAHRLSTLAHLDRIVVLDKGQIVEDGSHLQLLQRQGLY